MDGLGGAEPETGPSDLKGSVPSAPEPVEGGRELQDAEEAGSGLLVARRDCAPLLQPAPKALDAIAVVVDPFGAGDRGLVPLRRDRGPRAEVPGVLAEGMTGVATVGDDPPRHIWQTREQRHGKARGSSCACPGAIWKAMARPALSTIARIFVP